MKSNYADILALTIKEPVWYDENGTPRFVPFRPELCPSIYAGVIVLLRIVCQWCGEEFLVEMHDSVFSPIKHPHKLHYGDPPIHNCVGDTMNCEDLAVMEVWYREHVGDWIRRPELEGLIDGAADVS